MKSTRRFASLLLCLIAVVLVMYPVAASEFPPGQATDGLILSQDGDSTRILPVYDVRTTGNWVIHYDPNTPESEKWEYVNRIGATIVERIDELEIWVVDVPDNFGMNFTFDSDVEL
jgi:hypothetical protein